MTKFHITEDERWPVYDLNADLRDVPERFTVELTDEERADFDAVYAKWEAWQNRLFHIVEAADRLQP